MEVPNITDPDKTLVDNENHHDTASVLIKTNEVLCNEFNFKTDHLSAKNLRPEITKLKLFLNELTKKEQQLKQCLKIIREYKKEEEVTMLTQKWYQVIQCELNYLMNSTLLKFDKMGGYDEFIKREVEFEKQKLEYQFDDSWDDQYKTITESEDFQALSIQEQDDYKEEIENKKLELENLKMKKIEEIESKLVNRKEFDMKELCKMLNVDHDYVFNYPNNKGTINK
ncbi:uncharacterized protein SCODWIG_03318 [Saccharomycodes ludwigii]|uniref:Meiosis protein 5 n=1 Tax=Saccharomycodes ludwigii TaxID=36035 RepID=A0A376BA92_9ASCO|nr:hypothetical protein SCDLUD_002117 [Saccharomycodes ludwigii]KAH3902298.1 hypothetical protein SCDLUD_002117 [Saccharomycodes ludwigii]SSD61557.1 uncharacterized protein SCODWIG_03318 [Saccharomycodes ludwigii]